MLPVSHVLLPQKSTVLDSQLNVRLSSTERADVESLAVQLDVTPSQLARHCLTQYMALIRQTLRGAEVPSTK